MNTLNTFHANKFETIFSNLPTINSYKNMEQITSTYVKSITIPEYSIEYISSGFKGTDIYSPISRKNDALSPLTIEFKVSENLDNYYYFQQFIQRLRYGQNVDDVENIKTYTIKNIDIVSLDNQKRQQKSLRFTEAFLQSISSVNFEFGSGDEVVFNATFVYREIELVNYTL